MEGCVKQGRFPAEDVVIVDIFGGFLLVGVGVVGFGQFGDVEQRVPAPDFARSDWRLDLTVPRGEFPERDERAATGCVVEGDGAEEVRHRSIDQADGAEGVAGREMGRGQGGEMDT